MHRAIEDGKTVVLESVAITREEGSSFVRVTVAPAGQRGETEPLLAVIFEDVPRPATAGVELAPPGQSETAVKQLEDELKAAQHDHQSTIDDLLASNEELRVANEEVISGNEELQSTNEELETSKEELQSVNEELVTVNSQLQEKVHQLDAANSDMANLLKSSEIATLFLDSELRIKFFTPAMTRVLNLIPTDMGRPLIDLSVDLIGCDLAADARAVAGGASVMEKEVRHADGSSYLVRVAPYRTQMERVDGVVVTFIDITERKRAEEALRKSEQEFRALAETVPQIVWATRPDGWNIYFNQQWMDYTGLTLDESYGHGWNTPFHPDDKQRAWDAWQRATQHGEPYLLECRLRRADGVYRWWLIHGAPMRGANGEIQKWLGTCTDIEDLKQAEEALRESEQQFRALADSIPNLAWCANADGYTTWYNRRWYEYTGTTPEQMEGWGWQSVHHPDELLRVLERWKLSIATGTPFDMIFPLRGADGVFRLFLTRVMPLKNQQGQVQRWFGTNTDVSEQRQAEDELRASNQDLTRFNRAAVDRELRMIELKKEINTLCDRRRPAAAVPVGV